MLQKINMVGLYNIHLFCIGIYILPKASGLFKSILWINNVYILMIIILKVYA